MCEVSPKLSLAVKAFHQMANIRWQDGDCFGEIELTNENCNLLSDLQDESLLFPPDPKALIPEPGSFYEIQLQPPRSHSAFFSKSLDDLLNYPTYLHSPPETFFLADSGELYPSATQPSILLRGYLDTIKLIGLLKSLSDYSDSSTGHLRFVFLHKEKLEVQVLYGNNDLRPLLCVDKLDKNLAENVHTEQRRSILKRLLLEELQSFSSNDRFRNLLIRLDSIYQRFLDNYQLYVSEFSFDAIFKDISNKRLEYVLKLNKNFSDIQNQLLAVPLAALLAWSQMEKSNSIKNSLVFLTALIFAFFMSMLLRNQKASLAAIKEEISDQHKALNREYAALAPRFEKIYIDLDDRCNKHKCLLVLVDISVGIIIVVVPAALLFYYSIL